MLHNEEHYTGKKQGKVKLKTPPEQIINYMEEKYFNSAKYFKNSDTEFKIF